MSVKDVMSWMTFYGWTAGGGAGSVKHDAFTNVIAKHGDAAWIADVQEACDAIERRKIIDEIERRDRLGAGAPAQKTCGHGTSFADPCRECSLIWHRECLRIAEADAERHRRKIEMLCMGQSESAKMSYHLTSQDKRNAS